MAFMTAAWHDDADKKSRPDDFVGKKYFHPKTGHLYQVTGYGIDAQRELWILTYERAGDLHGQRFTYHHTITDFTREGRFLEVK